MTRSASDRRALVLACSAALAWCCAAATRAQRVEFPSTVPTATPYNGGSVYPSTPATTFAPPTSPATVYPSAPSSAFPATPPPTLPALGTPPAYDPYANPALGAPPIDVPYAVPPAATPPGISPYTVAPQPVYGAPAPAPTAQNGLAFPTGQWGNNSTYSYQNPDGTIAHMQRLLQQISLEHTYLYGKNAPGDLAINRTEMAATFGVPIFYNPNTPLLITPGFAFNWLAGPIGDQADLPPRVYDAYLDGAWYPRFNQWLSADLGLRTGVWTDFKAVNSDSIRILGRGLGVISISPRMDLLVGVWYLDRNDVKILPAGGLHWKPNTEWDAYLVFPNPKVRKRFVNIGSSQWWWYVAGEYGGGRWTVERSANGLAKGADDDIDINDIRVIGGLEWETQTQARGHLEVGYVFDRQIVYAGTRLPPTFDLDDTFMIRLGFDF